MSNSHGFPAQEAASRAAVESHEPRLTLEPTGGRVAVRLPLTENVMDTNTLLLIVILLLFPGGGYYGRKRWF